MGILPSQADHSLPRLAAHVKLEEMNTAAAYGAKRSLAMDFDDYDHAPMAELNEILWKSIKGVDAPVPPRRVAAFVGDEEKRQALNCISLPTKKWRTAGVSRLVVASTSRLRRRRFARNVIGHYYFEHSKKFCPSLCRADHFT